MTWGDIGGVVLQVSVVVGIWWLLISAGALLGHPRRQKLTPRSGPRRLPAEAKLVGLMGPEPTDELSPVDTVIEASALAVSRGEQSYDEHAELVEDALRIVDEHPGIGVPGLLARLDPAYDVPSPSLWNASITEHIKAEKIRARRAVRDSMTTNHKEQR